LPLYKVEELVVQSDICHNLTSALNSKCIKWLVL